MTTEREFKMQGGPPIPWSLAQRIYDETYSRFYGTSQSLERLNERGGFGWGEVQLMYARLKKREVA